LHEVDPIHFPLSDGSLASQPASQPDNASAKPPSDLTPVSALLYELDLHPSKSFPFLLYSDITFMRFQKKICPSINHPISLPEMFQKIK
jgi:hypothetical protein